MKIIRTGARANHGVKSVTLKIAKLKWNSTVDTFDLTFTSSAADFSTDARHTYTIRFSPSEMASEIDMLAEAGLAMDGEAFAAEFAKVLPSLFRLQAMASGMKLAA